MIKVLKRLCYNLLKKKTLPDKSGRVSHYKGDPADRNVRLNNLLQSMQVGVHPQVSRSLLPTGSKFRPGGLQSAGGVRTP